MIMFGLIPNRVNIDKFNTLLIFCYIYFLYVPYHQRLLRTTIPWIVRYEFREEKTIFPLATSAVRGKTITRCSRIRSWIVSTFTWLCSLRSWLAVVFLMISATVSIPGSWWRLLLCMYRGASTMFLTTLSWILWMMFMLLALAQSHTDLSICL